jgi:tetratricopeptide (TPR) repeat protein
VGNGGGARAGTATVLFTDLAGSTVLRRQLGDDQADDLRRRHDDAIRTAAAEHLGQVVKGTGDGVMLVFPAAAEAVAGAIAIQRSISRLNRNLPSPLGVRVGISAGDVSWEGDDCFGTPVVEAARLCDAATEGQILVSEIVRLLAGSRGGHRLESAGVLQLKGLGEMVAHEVAWESGHVTSLPLPPALSTNETLPLIGRVDERDALATAWKRALESTQQVALISGEPGVGKTRLAAELARRVHGDGAVVLFGRCDEELSVPYQPFAEAIGTYATACSDDVVLAQLGGSGGDLARLVPSLASRFANLPEPMHADAETERYRLFEAVTALLSAIATDAPVLLVIDDLHWAARPTLLLLRHVVRQRTVGKLMIVATYRDTDLGRGHPLSEALADLRREPDVERVALRGLDEAEVVELASTAAGHELEGEVLDLARAVYAETEGNPFFVGQVLRHLSETGALRVEDGHWIVTDRRGVGIPEGVREVIGKRLSQLADDTNEVLSVAAVIGRQFDNRLLTEASGLDADRVLDALEEAEASRLVVALAGHDDRRTFAHALVRSTLYEEIATTRRLRIHRRVAQALEARAGRGAPCLEELAHHCCESAALGDVESALRWSRAAAQAALDRLAYEEAASQYERALNVLDPDDVEQRVDRAQLGVELSRALRAGGLIPSAREAALAAADAARDAGRPDILVDAALVIGGDRGWTEAGLVDHTVVELLEEGLAAMPDEDSSLRAMATARLAGELYFLAAEADYRQRLTADAVAMAERIGDPDTLAFVLSCAVWGGWAPSSEREGLEHARRIGELGRESGNRMHELTGTMWELIANAIIGDGDELRACVDRERVLAEYLRRPEYLWISTVHRAAVALMDARLDDAATLADEALRVGVEVADQTAMQMYGVAHLALTRSRGGLEEVLPVVASMVEQFPLIPAWRCALAYTYRELDMLDEAGEQLDILAVDDFRGMPLDANWSVGMSIIATVCNSRGDQARAQIVYDLLLPHSESIVIAGLPAEVLNSMHGSLALLAATLGRWDEAEAHHRAGEAANLRMGNRLWVITDRFEWGRVIARRGWDGDADGARGILETCAAEAREVGMTRVHALAADLLASLT